MLQLLMLKNRPVEPFEDGAHITGELDTAGLGDLIGNM